MDVPAAPAPEPQPEQQQPRRRAPAENLAETVLQQVLRDLFGGN